MKLIFPVIVTTSKKLVRVWEIEGSLLWEESIVGTPAISQVKDTDSDGIPDLVIYSGTSSPFLKLFGGRDGRIFWQKDMTGFL